VTQAETHRASEERHLVFRRIRATAKTLHVALRVSQPFETSDALGDPTPHLYYTFHKASVPREHMSVLEKLQSSEGPLLLNVGLESWREN
jgi:hypothetical protein